MSRILLTGSGMVASALASEAHMRGHTVQALPHGEVDMRDLPQLRIAQPLQVGGGLHAVQKRGGGTVGTHGKLPITVLGHLSRLITNRAASRKDSAFGP